MAGLPFEVVYGHWIWAAAALFLVLAMFAYARRRLRARGLVHWRDALDGLGTPGEAQPRRVGERVTIAGRIEAEGSAERFDDGSPAALASADQGATSARRRAERLYVVTEAESVELAGDVTLRLGSVEHSPQRPVRRLSASVRERLGDGFDPDDAVRFRAVHAGDHVVARGTLRMSGSGADTGYRESGHRYALDDGELASARPPRFADPLPRVSPILAAAALFLLVFGGGGKLLKEISQHRDRSPATGELLDVFRSERADRLLAITPFHREGALERLARSVDSRAAPTREAKDALVALAELRGDCAEVIRQKLIHRDFRGALSRYQGCDSGRARELAADAAYFLGDVDAASELLAEPLDEFSPRAHQQAARVHLLAGDIERAAEAAARAAAHHGSDRAVGYRCLAEALRARAGDAGARERLAGFLAGPCRLLRADLAADRERESLLRNLSDLPFSVDALPALLRAERGPVEHGDDLLKALDSVSHLGSVANHLMGVGGSHTFGLGYGLEGELLTALRGIDELPASAARAKGALLARAIMAEMLIGNRDSARELLAELESDGDLHALARVSPPLLRAFFAIRGGDLGGAEAALDDLPSGEGERGADARAFVATVASPGEPLHHFYLTELIGDREVVVDALSGDGRALAAALPDVQLHFSQLIDSLAPISPWLPEDVLAACVRYCRGTAYSGRSRRVGEAVRHLANLAAVAEAAGEVEMAKDAAQGARALREASLRREIAVPLALLDAL